MAVNRKPVCTRRIRRAGLWKLQPTAANKAGLQAAMAALYGDGAPMGTDEALALREQLRMEDEAKRQAQGCLPLRTQGD